VDTVHKCDRRTDGRTDDHKDRATQSVQPCLLRTHRTAICHCVWGSAPDPAGEAFSDPYRPIDREVEGKLEQGRRMAKAGPGQKIPLRFSYVFPKRLDIFSPNFAHLLHVPIYARLQIFIQLTSTVTIEIMPVRPPSVRFGR